MHSTTSPLKPSPPSISKSFISRLLTLHVLPSLFRPLIRAFLLGYLTTTLPPLLTLLAKYLLLTHKTSIPIPSSTIKKSLSLASLKQEAAVAVGLTGGDNNGVYGDIIEAGEWETGLRGIMKEKTRVAKEMRERRERREEISKLIEGAKVALVNGFGPREFPVFCAVVAGGSTILQGPLLKAIHRPARKLSKVSALRLSRLLATFISAYTGISLLCPLPAIPPPSDPSLTPLPSQTLDLSLLAATRALDFLITTIWTRWRARRETSTRFTRFEKFLGASTDPIVFSVSSALIMWSWFYHPTRLPKSYTTWITSAASVDHRLIEALRRCRFGWLIYGQETGQAPLLQEMCKDYKWPMEWGDPALTVPFPCEMVHMGKGGWLGCEGHAAWRWIWTWGWMMARCGPVVLLIRIIRAKKSWADIKNAIYRALRSSSRSSAIIATFTALFYYGVCLMRTRIGPRILGRDNKTCTRIDGGLCIGAGCALCGWSILLESAAKRQDLSLFMAPKALRTLVKGDVVGGQRWVEAIVFATSTAVVFSGMAEDKSMVRGLMGKVLAKVMET